MQSKSLIPLFFLDAELSNKNGLVKGGEDVFASGCHRGLQVGRRGRFVDQHDGQEDDQDVHLQDR